MKIEKRRLVQIVGSVIVFVLVLGLVACSMGQPENPPAETEPLETIEPTTPSTEPTVETEAPTEESTPPTESIPPETEETEHVHDYEEYIVNATCTDDGVKEYTCRCGDVKTEYIPALGHDYSKWIIDEKATCVKEGKTHRTCATCQYQETQVIEKVEHDYKSTVTSPTCTKEGYTTYTCTVCEKTYKDNYVDPAHSFTDWEIISEANCESYGQKTRSCTKCNYAEGQIIGALGHDFEKALVEPTCTEKGYTVFTCTRCEYEYVSEYTEPTGHTYSAWSIVKAATCLNDGKQTRTCSCGNTETEIILKLGHDLVHHEGKSASCEENGWEAYDTCSRCDFTNYKEIIKIGHVFGDWYIAEDATCTETGTKARMCLNCKKLEEKEIPVVDHVYVTTTVASTCTEKGYDLHACICGDSYKDNYTELAAHEMGEWEEVEPSTCIKEGTERRKCKNCEHTEMQLKPFRDHNYEMVVTEPTCTEAGYTTCTCLDCGDIIIINRKLPNGHKFMDWMTSKPATCTEAGVERRMCMCGETETRAINALGHDEVIHSAKDATCKEVGWKEYVTCSRCEYSTYEEIAKTNHSYVDTITNPTCTEKGYTTHTCSVCGDSYKDAYVDTIDHSNYFEVTEPTCTKEGYTTQICSVCGAKAIDGTTPALGHEFTNYISNNDATCTENGTKTAQCNRNCGETHTVTDEGSVLGHDYDEKVTAPTCKEKGFTTYTCSACGHSYDGNYVDVIAHTYESVVTAPTCTAKGYTTFTCSCGHSYVGEETEMLEHNYTEEITAPTCTSKGYTTFTCSACGYNYKGNETAKTEHDWSDWEVVKQPTTTETGLEQRQCADCLEIEAVDIPMIVLSDNIVVYYKVIDGKVIDLVSGTEMANATVAGDYFSGGKVVLPATYSKYTIETIMIYNRNSLENPISENFAYYGGALKFQEVETPSNWHYIKTPFGGGQIWTDFTLRPSLNHNTRVFSDGESYWAFAVDADAGSYSVQINDNYVNKSHWANATRKTFTLSTDHTFKEFIVYSEMLTKETLAEHFENTNISLHAETDTLVGRVTNGITDLGSAFAFTQTGRYGVPEWLKTSVKAGNYSVNDNNGVTLNYTISDYVEPDLGIDHSKYESVHIINNPETLCVDYKYALSAVPYPFNVNHNGVADQYDVSWSSSDTSIASIIDGLIIPKKTGTVTITATLRGTTMSDSCTIKIVAKENVSDTVFNVPANYVSANGNSFSDTNYTMTTNAIYDVIDEAYFAGYNHVVFPQIDFYAAPTGTTYYIPTGMTVEFPEGSAFHMMPSDVAKTDGYTFFQMGGAWWSCGVPANKSYKKTDADGNVLAYYCKDAHLIIDKYYGEFYKADATMDELNTGANEYAWGCVLLSMGKRAEYCSVEIREANCPTGFFILMGGKGNNEMINAGGGTIAADKFVSGWLDDTGTIVENGNWISTPDFYTVSPGAANGMDTLHEYYMGEWDHNVTTATQHLYDILWFDENKELIQINRWQYVDEGYSNKPTGAKYFKISMQQSELPTGTDFYIGLYPDESTRFCEIKNTKIINGADGLASVVGATNSCWIHDNYVSGDGLLSGACWSLDLEDGWMGMRGTIIERNILRKYAYSASHGEYRGPDSGILALASGYNTFVISNYLGAVQQSNYNVANTHIINNVIYSMYSGFTSGQPNELRTKINAHVYYNIIGQNSNAITANGVVYRYGNTNLSSVNLW